MPRSRRKSTFEREGGAVSETRRYTTEIMTSGSVRNGRADQDDPVVKQFGGWEGLSLYERMLRQFPFLYGICNQFIQPIAGIDRSIKPGIPGDPTSEDMAEQTRDLYRRIPERETIIQRLLWGKYFGIAAAEMVWETDAATGLRAPLKIYDLEPWHLKFGPNGELFILTAQNPYEGEEVDPFNFLISRWGSKHSPYGKGALRYAYFPTHMIQQLQRLMLDAIEKYGKPIPWLKYWEGRDPGVVNQQKAALASQFKHYVATPVGNAADEKLEFPSLNVVASGAAGRAEMQAIEFYVGQCYIALLGAQQTQAKTGGSRALETTRREIAMDQTPPGSQMIDAILTQQWSNRIWQVNAPSVARKYWPRFDSDIDASDFIDGTLLAQIASLPSMQSNGQLPQKWVEELLVRASFDRRKAVEMATSVPDDLEPIVPPVASSMPQPAKPPDTEEPDEKPDEESEDDNEAA